MLDEMIFILAVTALSLGGSSASACTFCTKYITMTPDRATCFELQADDLHGQVSASQAAFVIVDMGICGRNKSGQIVKRGVQDGMETPKTFDLDTVDQTIILDQSGIACLSELITNKRDKLAPELVFDMQRDCK